MKKAIIMILIFAACFTVLSGCSKKTKDIKEGDEFKNLLQSAEPIFVDKFDDKEHTPETISSAYYKQSVPSTRNIKYVKGVEGKGMELLGYDSYVGYPDGILSENEGSIRFLWKPDKNIHKSYNTRQKSWVDYGSIKPPFSGFLIDAVGWNPAFSGGFSLTLAFKEKNNDFSNMHFGTWSGSSWSYTESGSDIGIEWNSKKWYDIIVSYSSSKRKIQLYIDEELIGQAPYNTSLSKSEGFFIGQSPWSTGGMEYWPYGPHSMKGTYSYLRIYDVALME